MLLEYDGTDFAGFQVQPNRPTVQGELERAIAAVCGHLTRVVGAGRTDAGVHALGQVASFTTESRLTTADWVGALNAHLPPAIAVRGVREVPEGFSARYSATSRAYRYTILNRPGRGAIGRQYRWHLSRPLDEVRMSRALASLVGTHDFSRFAGSSGDHRGSTIRTVMRATCTRADEQIHVDIEANAFLTHMVRNIVGGLVEVGLGRAEEVAPGTTAPAHGLCLVSVNYGDRNEDTRC